MAIKYAHARAHRSFGTLSEVSHNVDRRGVAKPRVRYPLRGNGHGRGGGERGSSGGSIAGVGTRGSMAK